MSQTAREYLESEVRRLTEKARAVTRKAEDEGRLISSDERGEVEGIVKDVTELKSRLEEMDSNEKLLESIRNAGAIGQAEPTVAPKQANTWGDAFVQSEGFKAFKARGTKGAWSTGPVEIGQKLTDTDGNTVIASDIGSGDLNFGPGSTNTFPQRLPGIQGPVEQALTIADLLGSGVATANTITYLKEINAVNGAALTSEGGVKPPSSMEFDRVSVAVEKIATFLPVSDEMMEDEAQVVSYINARLALFVRQVEESYILDALLAAPGAASSTDVGGSNLFDAIAAGILSVRVDAGLEPDALVIHPADAAELDTAKAEGGTGMYYSGGPYGAPAQNPWGLRRVVTTAVTENSPVVGAFRAGATVWRRGGLSVEASNSHADYFARNLTAIRAEERLAVSVYRDEAFCVVTANS